MSWLGPDGKYWFLVILIFGIGFVLERIREQLSEAIALLYEINSNTSPDPEIHD